MPSTRQLRALPPSPTSYIADDPHLLLSVLHRELAAEGFDHVVLLCEHPGGPPSVVTLNSHDPGEGLRRKSRPSPPV